MQDTKAKLGPLLGLLSSLAVLGAVALVLTRALGGEAEAARRISQTHLTIESIDEVLYALADAESSARGYAISRDTRLLSSLERSLAELRTGIRATKRLVIHNPSQASRVDGIERQLERRHDLFIEYRDAALRASEVPPISAESRQLSQDLRDALVQMKQEESRLLSERTSEVARERKSASTIELIGVLVGTTVLLLAFFVVVWEIRARRKAEREASEKSKLLYAIASSATDSIYVKDRDGRYLYVNEAGRRVFNRPLDEVIGFRDADLLSDFNASEGLAHHFEVLRAGKSSTREERITHNGVVRTYETVRSPLLGELEDIVGVAAFSRDVTEAKVIEAARALDTKRLLSLGEMLQVSNNLDEAYEVFRQIGPDFVGAQNGALYLFPATRAFVESRAAWGNNASRIEQTRFTAEDCWALRRGKLYRTSGDDESLRCKHVDPNHKGPTLCLPLLAHAEMLGVLCIASDTPWSEYVERKSTVLAEQLSLSVANIKLRETLREQSIRDPLTGLFNRRYFEETLEREVQRSKREKTPLSLIVVDVDHFKRVNDTYGHATGDLILREIGGLMRACTRGGDVASRIGGEELVMMLPGASLDDAMKKAEQLRLQVRALRLKEMNNAIASVTISVGVSVFPENGGDPPALFGAADAALYQAKHAGRDRVIAALEPVSSA